MDNITEKEILKLKSDIENSQKQLENEKNDFADKLKNGMGDEIIYTLSNPAKQDGKLQRKLKFRRKLKIIKENLAKIL